MPLLTHSVLDVTTVALGAVFELVVWLDFYVLFVPLANLAPVGFAVWVLSGVLTGALYGFVRGSRPVTVGLWV